MTNFSELVAVDLTEDEREFIRQTLDQWGWSASNKPFPFQLLGLSSWQEFGQLVVRLSHAISTGDPLTDLDWARVLFLTEITWASSLVGSGLDFAIVTKFSDVQAVGLLRGLQRKIGRYDRALLLFPNGGRTRTAEENRGIGEVGSEGASRAAGAARSPWTMRCPAPGHADGAGKVYEICGCGLRPGCSGRHRPGVIQKSESTSGSQPAPASAELVRSETVAAQHYRALTMIEGDRRSRSIMRALRC